MVKKLGAILIFLSAGLLAKGQSTDAGVISLEYPVYSQYLQNGLMINPAYTGSRGSLSTFLSYRIQWMGTSGSPVIQSASIHAPMKNDHVAFGLMAHFMQYGYTRSSSVYFSYAYHIRMGKGKLSLGLKGGFDRSNTDFTGIKLNTPDDPVFTTNQKPYMLPNMGAGAYYFSDKLFAGVSIPSFLSYRKTSTGTVEPFHSFGQYNVLFSGGGLISFSNAIRFKPSLLLDYSLRDSKINQLDINGNLILDDIIWLGGSWRTSEQVAVGILQLQVTPQLMIGFSYDYPAGRMNTFSKGSSEFILRYEFGYKVSAANPRYF